MSAFSETDILVIGAGPGGSVAASVANLNGLKVRVIEKARFPRFVIGESLLPRCMDALEKADLLGAIEECGFQKKYGAKFIRDGKVCEFSFSDQYTDGHTWTWQVPRSEFDHKLITEVAKKGVQVEFERSVTGIEFDEDHALVTTENEAGEKEVIKAGFVIDSSGYGRVLPRLLNLDKPSNLPPRKSVFMHVKDAKRTEGAASDVITIIDHKPGVWVWVIPFSNGNCSVGFVGDPDYFDTFEGDEMEKFKTMIDSVDFTRERFKDIPYLWDAPKVLSGYAISTLKFYDKHFALTGNAAEFLDPVFSSGVTFAMESGVRAAELACRQLKGEEVNWKKDYEDYILDGVNVFRSYVMAWYDGSLQDIFFAKTSNPEIKSMICSVLAGYVWDKTNYYVKEHGHAIHTLSGIVRMYG
ncbi:MAG: tryptophan 7-halogenase [Flavobacteriales bacterium]|nr:tryptophan 7-halogenase [Flavobacteriales bacterium]